MFATLIFLLSCTVHLCALNKMQYDDEEEEDGKGERGKETLPEMMWH